MTNRKLNGTALEGGHVAGTVGLAAGSTTLGIEVPRGLIDASAILLALPPLLLIVLCSALLTVSWRKSHKCSRPVRTRGRKTALARLERN
jgi:hypothetical protein